MTTAHVETRPAPTRRGRGWLRGAGLLLLTALFTAGIAWMMLALAGHFEPKVKSSAAATAPAPIQEPTAAVKLVKRPRSESAVGTIRAVHEVNVASKILARVKEVRVKAGQSVKANDVIVVLDDADL